MLQFTKDKTTRQPTPIGTQIVVHLSSRRDGINHKFAGQEPAVMGLNGSANGTSNGKHNGVSPDRSTNGKSNDMFNADEQYMTANVRLLLVTIGVNMALRKPVDNVLREFAETFEDCSEEEQIAIVKGIAHLKADAIRTNSAMLPDLETMLRIASTTDSVLVQLYASSAMHG